MSPETSIWWINWIFFMENFLVEKIEQNIKTPDKSIQPVNIQNSSVSDILLCSQIEKIYIWKEYVVKTIPQWMLSGKI